MNESKFLDWTRIFFLFLVVTTLRRDLEKIGNTWIIIFPNIRFEVITNWYSDTSSILY